LAKADMGAAGAIGRWNWGIEAFRVPGAAQRVAQRNGALQTRDLSTFGTWYGPGSAVHRKRAAPHPGKAARFARTSG